MLFIITKRIQWRIHGLAIATGLVHKDLKPENVLCSQGSRGNSEVKIVDFGISSLEDANRTDTATAGGALYHAPFAGPHNFNVFSQQLSKCILS